MIQPLEGRIFLTNYEQPPFSKAPSEEPAIFTGLADFWRNRYGDPRFRVVWGEQAIKTRGGQDILAYRKRNPVRIQIGWMQGNVRYPITTDPKTLPRLPVVYPIYETRWEGYPFWILEEWESPEFLATQWEPRYKFSEREGKVVDWMGDVPERGCYRAVAFIHDGNFGYTKLPERLPQLVHGLVATVAADPLENPYADNTLELQARRREKLDKELAAIEQASIDEFADRMVDALKKPNILEDLQTAVHSEVDYHKKRWEQFKHATRQ